MNVDTAKTIAEQMGFIVTQKTEHDIFERMDVEVYKIDRIGPPAMLKHYVPSPFNDRLVSGPSLALVEWVGRLCEHSAAA
jgi:hypothetical protein